MPVPESDWDEGPNSIGQRHVDELKAILSEHGPTSDLKTEPTEVGRGASGAAIFIALATVFLAGKKINEALNAWIDIAQKVHRMFSRVGGYGSEAIGLAIAIDHLRVEAHLSMPRLVSHAILPIRGGFISKTAEDSFISNPERFYVFVIADGDDRAFSITVKSTGEVVFYFEMDTRDFYAFHGIQLDHPEQP